MKQVRHLTQNSNGQESRDSRQAYSALYRDVGAAGEALSINHQKFLCPH